MGNVLGSKRGPYQNFKTADILAMLADGSSNKDIAAAVGCSSAYVVQCKRRHVTGNLKFAIAGLPDDLMRSLRKMAIASDVTSAEMARALLVYAIEEATAADAART